MRTSESIFWGLVGVSAMYLTLTFTVFTKASPQVAAQAPDQAAMQGMGCMAGGDSAGCGCGAMQKQ